MSRGLGKTQKRILRLLGTKKWKKISDLTDKLHWRYTENCNHWPGSAYISIYRAVKALEKRGLVEIVHRVEYGTSIMGQYAAPIIKIRKVKS